MNPLTQSKNEIILPVLIALMLSCFALSPQARATCREGCDLTNQNTFLGDDALISNTIGVWNTAIGFHALYGNTTSAANTAIGYNALQAFTTGGGDYNTAIGWSALQANTTGNNNTATGSLALFSNTTGFYNTATGTLALAGNTTGSFNTATGLQTLNYNTTGYQNTATGAQALIDNTIGTDNTATGTYALSRNTTGSENTANGFAALNNNTTGNHNTAVGYQAGVNLTTGDNNIDIGNVGVAGEANTIRIGTVGTQTATYIAGIRDARLVHGAAVTVGITDDGQLGVRASSARFKEAIKPMDKASEVIFSLQPVTFHYKKDLDPEAVPQFGLVAEQVAKVDSDLVARDADGKPYTVRYEEVNAMLLNEFLKEHHKGQEQDATISQLKAELAQQQKEIKTLSAQIQKVSAQLEASKPAPQVVNNP